MRTIVMPEHARDSAWLEHFAEDGDLPHKTPIDRFPFVIGRGDSADLQLDSVRVSREHSVLLKEGREYRIRDLDSTNGTFVNGQRIQEAVLHHGDMLQMANVELTFHSTQPGACSRAVTQPLGLLEDRDDADRAVDLRQEVRRLHEVLARGGLSIAFDPIVLLADGQVFGYEARCGEGTDFRGPETKELLRTVPWPIAARVRQLQRARAVEESEAFPGSAVFVRVEPCDLGVRGLAESIGSLRGLLAGGRRLIAVLPREAMRDTGQVDRLARPLREAGIGIALDGLRGEPGEVPQGGFDYLKLAGPRVRGAAQIAEQQRAVRDVAQAGRERGWEVIATGICNKEEWNVCRGLGCVLGQGPLFADLPSPEPRRPQAVHAT